MRLPVATAAQDYAFYALARQQVIVRHTSLRKSWERHLVQEQETHDQGSNHTFQGRGVKRLPVGIGSNSRNEVSGAERNR